MILDYIVEYGGDCDHLQEEVRERIITGWQPLGGVGVYSTPGRRNGFYQAMVLVGDLESGPSGKQMDSKPLPEQRGNAAQGE